MSEIIEFKKNILLVVSNLCKFHAHFCTVSNLNIYSLWNSFLAVLPALSYTHRITFVGRFKCIGRMACALPKPVSQPHFYLDDWCLPNYNDMPQLSGDFIFFGTGQPLLEV